MPLLQAELVEKKGWLGEDELVEYYALSQSIPGIIAANVSIFTGYRLDGQRGAIAAILGVITPAFVAIVLLATVLEILVHFEFMQSMFWGIGIGVIILLFLAIKEMWKKSIVDRFTCGVFLGAFLLSACFKMSPAVIVVLAILAGIIYKIRYTQGLSGEEITGDDVK